ncbi:MAG: hypothetical protein U1F00_10870 [Rhodoferax sp.]
MFVGMYATGNLVDILINPEATQAERAATVAAFGLDKPVGAVRPLPEERRRRPPLFAYSTPARR